MSDVGSVGDTAALLPREVDGPTAAQSDRHTGATGRGREEATVSHRPPGRVCNTLRCFNQLHQTAHKVCTNVCCLQYVRG